MFAIGCVRANSFALAIKITPTMGLTFMDKNATFSAVELIQQYRQELMNYLTYQHRCPEIAEDILQETYIRLVNYLSIETIQNPRAFLYRIVNNLAIDYHRSQHKMFVHENESVLADVAEDTPSLEHHVFTQEQITALKHAIAELPPRCRQVFIMHKFKHYPYSKIATELAISESTIVKHIVKAMAHCRQRLQELG